MYYYAYDNKLSSSGPGPGEGQMVPGIVSMSQELSRVVSVEV